MKKMILVTSPPACGKTRLSKRLAAALDHVVYLDKDTLMAAHENPMLYPDLVVRVTGFTAYFAALSKEFRQLVVDRFLEGI